MWRFSAVGAPAFMRGKERFSAPGKARLQSVRFSAGIENPRAEETVSQLCSLFGSGTNCRNEPRSGDICFSRGRKPAVKWEKRPSRGAAALVATQSLKPVLSARFRWTKVQLPLLKQGLPPRLFHRVFSSLFRRRPFCSENASSPHPPWAPGLARWMLSSGYGWDEISSILRKSPNIPPQPRRRMPQRWSTEAGSRAETSSYRSLLSMSRNPQDDAQNFPEQVESRTRGNHLL